jgi:gamma-glutamylcysteine synthetase
MTSTQIQSIGNFLAYYKTDLNYIKRFQNFKINPNLASEYIKKDIGSFYSFLIEFRVVRNFTSGSADKLLDETLLWINSKEANNVDLFAEKLSQSNLTRGKVTTSMASKILFLNNPWEIIPMDRLARKTLKQKENKYSIYNANLLEFRRNNEQTFENCLEFIKPLTTLIHNDFNDLSKLEVICKNRIVDKLLWTMGNNNIS